VQAWLGAAVFALLAWALQRLLSKVALADLGTRKFYLLSAAVSLITYLPYLLIRPPAVSGLLPAFGLACLMAVTFGVTTEAVRRGRLGTVSPITALSPALSAALGLLILGERATWPVYLGIALAPAGIVLVSLAPGPPTGERGGWDWRSSPSCSRASERSWPSSWSRRRALRPCS
jgi:drug/metabolite transporter (DMT)-like permease